MKRLFAAIYGMLIVVCLNVHAQTSATYHFVGQVIDAKDGEPVAGTAINIKDTGIWTVSDDEGNFSFDKIQEGKITIIFTCLGYEDKTLTLNIVRNIDKFRVKLNPSTLALKSVTVTAERDKDGLNSSLLFGANALEHLQMSNITDINALLPGGKTINPDLTTDNTISLRSGGLAEGNAAFGTAVEVDGVRLGGNASFGAMSGSSTRSISTQNIQSIEVITGVASAEYGDMNSGMVRIHTKKGAAPTILTCSANPRTYSTAISKGIDLQNGKGILNLSGEWTRAASKLSSPYTSYTRRGFSATYNNTFAKTVKFEAGITGNIGGMNTSNDPDAYMGTWSKGRDNVLQAHISSTYLVNRPLITNLKFDASINFNDNRTQDHQYSSSASVLPAIHSTSTGYHLADKLPLSYYSDKITDSKELDIASSLKYEWFRKKGALTSKFKAGIQWKANGNVGLGEYYLDASLAANGYRPRPYKDYPFMHNLALYAEEDLTMPLGSTTLEMSAGLRMENVYAQGTMYDNVSSLSPRFNAKWKITKDISVRGGWGISEKLPSFHILYPIQNYRDIQVFGFSHGESASYVYYTQPYTILYNEQLKWQRNHNAEFGIDALFSGISISLTAFYNKTCNPYTFTDTYSPFSYRYSSVPSGYAMPDNPQIKVDSQTGDIYVRGDEGEFWTLMDTKVIDKTFNGNRKPSNGADIHRAGLEMTMDLPEISPISTKFRIDANYSYTKYVNENLTYIYRSGWSHTGIPNRSYQYIGIYPLGDNTSGTWNGKLSHSLDANITAITHIPEARLIITCRLEMSLLKRTRNLSEYQGKEYAFNSTQGGTESMGGSIYSGNSYTSIYPVQYMDEDGVIHEFTHEDAGRPELANLIIKSGNAYTFALDGYGPYFSANLSVTKEIGDKVSLSFFANNFTNSRMYVKSIATGVSAVFTPAFYYGMTCRIKF